MKSYIIRSKNGMEAEILPEKGATVTALRKGGVDFLYQDQEIWNLRSGPGSAFRSCSRPSDG